MPKHKLTQKRLKEILHYNPKAGIFTWLRTRGGAIKGDDVGYINKVGYRIIGIDNKLYNASRLAWLYMSGYFPEHEVDHRDRIKNNNKWENLRHVSHQCNLRNCKKRNTNTSGITGVSWHKRCKKWQVQIKTLDRLIHIGYFNSKLNAAKARWEAEKGHNFPNCNSKSTAYLYLKSHNPLT